MMLSDKVLQRFNLSFTKSDGCWEWAKHKFWQGYGAFWCSGKYWKAHRFSYTLYVGEVPSGQYVCHTCDNPSCVSPDHLWLGTHKQNMEDKVRKGRSPNFKGNNHPGVILTDEIMLEIKEKIKQGYKPWGKELAAMYGVDRNTIMKRIQREEGVKFTDRGINYD